MVHGSICNSEFDFRFWCQFKDFGTNTGSASNIVADGHHSKLLKMILWTHEWTGWGCLESGQAPGFSVCLCLAACRCSVPVSLRGSRHYGGLTPSLTAACSLLALEREHKSVPSLLMLPTHACMQINTHIHRCLFSIQLLIKSAARYSGYW